MARSTKQDMKELSQFYEGYGGVSLMARRLGVSRATVHRWIEGAPASALNRRRIAELLAQEKAGTTSELPPPSQEE